jgi:hypothetical protein
MERTDQKIDSSYFHYVFDNPVIRSRNKLGWYVVSCANAKSVPELCRSVYR